MPADIGTTLAAWVSTSGSNQPQGATTVGANVDDNLRELQGVIVRGLSHKGADIASATTTDIGAIEGLMHDITGTTTITGLGTVSAGIWKILKFEGALTLTHNATSLILPGGANITTADGDAGIFFSEGSGNWRCVKYQKASGRAVVEPAASNGEYRSVQVFTGNGTWTKPASLVRVKVTVTGGGGGGGGNSQGTNTAAGGGGAGGTAIKTIAAASLGATETVTVGAAGAGGAAANNGSPGGNSTFGSHCTGGQGIGGVGVNATTAGNGGDGGTGSTGDINIAGGSGHAGIGTASGTAGIGGHGGASFFGGGGLGGFSSANGAAGAAFGSGGGGSADNNTASRTGGAGVAGIIIVEEFF